MVKVFTIKISEDLISEIKEMAGMLGITANSLATLLLSNGIVDVKKQIKSGKPIEFKVELKESETKLNEIIDALNKEYIRQETKRLKRQIAANKKKQPPSGIGAVDWDERM